MRRTYTISGLFLLVTLGVIGAGATVRAQGWGQVTIVLLPEVIVDDCMVTLEQIAKLSGGPEYLRKRLGKLDVTEFRLGAAYTTVLAEQVRFRLLLAGVEAAQIDLRGAKRTLVVESQEPTTDRKSVG